MLTTPISGAPADEIDGVLWEIAVRKQACFACVTS